MLHDARSLDAGGNGVVSYEGPVPRKTDAERWRYTVKLLQNMGAEDGMIIVIRLWFDVHLRKHVQPRLIDRQELTGFEHQDYKLESNGCDVVGNGKTNTNDTTAARRDIERANSLYTDPTSSDALISVTYVKDLAGFVSL